MFRKISGVWIFVIFSFQIVLFFVTLYSISLISLMIPMITKTVNEVDLYIFITATWHFVIHVILYIIVKKVKHINIEIEICISLAITTILFRLMHTEPAVTNGGWIPGWNFSSFIDDIFKGYLVATVEFIIFTLIIHVSKYLKKDRV